MLIRRLLFLGGNFRGVSFLGRSLLKQYYCTVYYGILYFLNVLLLFTSIVLVDPDAPTIINGGVMTLSGPSFNTTNTHEKISCVFTDDTGDRVHAAQSINGIIVNCKAICPMPLFKKLGPHQLIVNLRETRFVGEFEVGKDNAENTNVVV